MLIFVKLEHSAGGNLEHLAGRNHCCPGNNKHGMRKRKKKTLQHFTTSPSEFKRKHKKLKKKRENDKEKKKQVTFFLHYLSFFLHLFSFAVTDKKKLHRNVIIYNVDALKLSIIFSDGAVRLSLLLVHTFITVTVTLRWESV